MATNESETTSKQDKNRILEGLIQMSPMIALCVGVVVSDIQCRQREREYNKSISPDEYWTTSIDSIKTAKRIYENRPHRY